MTLFLFTLCALNLTGLAILAYAVCTAPDGFEDNNGFHRGDRPFDSSVLRGLTLS